MPYPICSVVAVFKMLVRILNTLRSRIWDMALFLFSDYLNPQLIRMEILQNSTLRFGRRKTIVHRTMCALLGAISDGGLTPPLILICCSPPTEAGVISHLIYLIGQPGDGFTCSESCGRGDTYGYIYGLIHLYDNVMCCNHTRACFKNAFYKMYVTICGRFCLNEGGVAGYVN